MVPIWCSKADAPRVGLCHACPQHGHNVCDVAPADVALPSPRCRGVSRAWRCPAADAIQKASAPPVNAAQPENVDRHTVRTVQLQPPCFRLRPRQGFGGGAVAIAIGEVQCTVLIHPLATMLPVHAGAGQVAHPEGATTLSDDVASVGVQHRVAAKVADGRHTGQHVVRPCQRGQAIRPQRLVVIGAPHVGVHARSTQRVRLLRRRARARDVPEKTGRRGTGRVSDVQRQLQPRSKLLVESRTSQRTRW